MNPSYYRRQLESKHKAHAAADKKVSEYRGKEASKRADAAKARAAAAKASTASTAKSKLSSAARCEDQAKASGRNSATWSGKAAKLSQDIADLEIRLAKAEQAERNSAAKALEKERQAAQRRAAAAQRNFESRLVSAERQVDTVLKELRAPKPERLRVLLLGAASDGDLRVGREQERIRKAVQSATHRDLVELDAHPAATAETLLDGLTRFRPHVVHFSGHSTQDLIAFEQDLDEPHPAAIVTAKAFANAISAVDEAPLLVLLNSCHSAAQTKHLITAVPFAIGMSDSIGDQDAITYATGFYSAVAEGQSVHAAHMLGRARVELSGLSDHELPTLDWASDVDPKATRLVMPPS